MHLSNRLLSTIVLPALLLPGISTFAEWTKVVDFEDYELTTDEADLIAKGWVFQDYDYFGYPECVDGTKDCDGYRAIIEAPFGGNGKAMEIRAGDPNVVEPINSRSSSAIDLTEEIPLNGTGTFYMRVSFERLQAAHHWGLTQVNDPVSGAEPPYHGFGDLGATTATGFFADQTPRVHSGGWITATEDLDQDMLPEIWYEIWYLVQNNDASLGSGVFDFYIRGGAFEEITHLTNYTLPQDLIDAGVTVWQFRNRVDQPIRRWLNVTLTDNPATNYVGTGAMYIDDMWVNVGELTTETPDGGSSDDEWAGYPLLPGGDCDTGDFLGWVNVAFAPYIFSYSLNQWMYIDESAVSGDGGWAYVFTF